MMVGRKDYVGSFELRGKTQDAIEGPVSEAYIQYYFQELFLQLFYEDPEFREQVLKCLLKGDNIEDTVEARKPRRTWFNGMGGIQEVSCEEARYLHLCSENPSIDSDVSTETGDTRCHVALKTKSAIPEKRPEEHLGGNKPDARMRPATEECPHSKMHGSKDGDMNQSGVLGHNSEVNYLLHGAGTALGPKDRPESTFPLEVPSDGQYKNLEKSSTGPFVHERRTQTWKANPLFLLSNIDSDSNDSWQQEAPNVAWMDDLENGKMLQEVKIREMKRSEDSRPSLNAEGYDRLRQNSVRQNSESDRERYFPCNVQGPSHYSVEDSKTADLQRRHTLNDEQTKNLSSGSFCRPIPSFIIVIPKQTNDATVTASSETKFKEHVVLGGKISRNPPFESECRDLSLPCLNIHRDDVGHLSPSRTAETTASCQEIQDRVLKPPHTLVSQELQVSFLQEDEKALFKQPWPEISPLEHKLDGKDTLISNRTSGMQDFIICKNEKPENSLKSISPVGTKLKSKEKPCEKEKPKMLLKSISPVESKLKSEEKLSAPVSNISSSAMLGEINLFQEESKPLVSTHGEQPGNLEMKLLCKTERIYLPPKAVVDDPGEGIWPSESICRSTKTLEEELNICQRLPPSMSSTEFEQVVAKKTLNEQNKMVELEKNPSGKHTKASSVEEESPELVACSQTSTFGSIIGDETIEAPNMIGDMLSEKETSSALSPRSLRMSRPAAIDEEEQVLDPPKSVAESVLRPIGTRPAFKPAKDIQWIPPKRNIPFLKIQTRRLPAQHSLDYVKKARIKWDMTCDCPQSQAQYLEPEEAVNRMDQMKKDSPRNYRNRTQLWASLLSKLFKRTIMIGWEPDRKKSDQAICS